MWDPQPLTTLRASKACSGKNFTFLSHYIILHSPVFFSRKSQYFILFSNTLHLPYLLRTRNRVVTFSCSCINAKYLHFSSYICSVVICVQKLYLCSSYRPLLTQSILRGFYCHNVWHECFSDFPKQYIDLAMEYNHLCTLLNTLTCDKWAESPE
jgi:hypothetical protein